MKKQVQTSFQGNLDFLMQAYQNLMSNRSIFLLGLLFLTATTFAQPYVLRHNLTSAQYQTEVNKWTGAQYGYRISQVSGYSDNGTDKYAAIFEKKSGPTYVARHNLTPAQYQNEVNTLKAQGYRPVQVSGFPSGADAKYAAIFFKEASAPASVPKHGMTAAVYQAEFNKWTGLGYQLTDISGYTVGGIDYYAAIWEKIGGPLRACRHRMTSAEYQDEYNEKSGQGYRLLKVSGYSIGNQPRFAAIWEKTTGPTLSARHAINGAQNYQDEADRYFYVGYRPTWINGYTVNNQDFFAGTWICNDPFKSSEMKAVDDLVKAYMDANDVPGISIALARNGKLMFARTYGFADQEANEKVAPRHLFRIASVSKPFTASAIMKLEQDNKIELSEKIFGSGAILGTTYGGSGAYTPDLKKITVDHLLTHHAGGWDQDGDPILQNQSWNMTTYLTNTLNNYPLDTDPGSTYDYSNYGFALLGRVIEKKSGKTYESFVKDNILTPCGISAMKIGGSTLAERKTNEVKYYGNNAYFYNIPRMDAHGGWIASPIDLVRFLVRVDQSATVPDILTAGSQTTMFTPSATRNSYCKGWSRVSNGNYWHNGALPSTLSEMKRTADGFCIAILMNTRPVAGKDSNGGGMGTLLVNIKDAISYWPNHNLF